MALCLLGLTGQAEKEAQRKKLLELQEEQRKKREEEERLARQVHLGP